MFFKRLTADKDKSRKQQRDGVCGDTGQGYGAAHLVVSLIWRQVPENLKRFFSVLGKSLALAGDICVYTNHNAVVETL